MSVELEELAKRLQEKLHRRDYPKDGWLDVAREVKIIEIEARLDEIVKVPRTEQYFYDRKHELIKQLKTLKGTL